MLSSAFLLSCRCSGTREWQQVYSSAHSQFERGDLQSALDQAEKGFEQTAQRDPEWNWRFRVLKAEILLWQTKSSDVLRVLAIPPPTQLAKGEFAVRGIAAEGMALAFLRRYEEATARFKRADELASAVAPDLRCEVELFEGNEARARGQSGGTNDALRQRQYAMAEQHYERSLQLARQYQQPYFEVGAIFGLANVATEVGRFDEGIDWSLQALGVARNHQFVLAENYAIANIARSYAQLGDLDKAISKFLEEVRVVDRLNQLILREHLFNNLGDAYLAQGNYSAAYDVKFRALDIAKALDENRDSDEKLAIVKALTDIAGIVLAQGQMSKAEDYGSQAVAIDPTDPNTILVSAKIAAARHNFTAAKAGLQRILAAKDAENFIRWDAGTELAEIFVAEHQNRKAAIEFQRTIDEIESARSGLHVIENRLAFSSHSRRAYDDYIRYLFETGRREKAFRVAEFSRARILAEGVGLKAPASPSDVSIGRIQSFLRQQRKIILAYWLSPEKSFLWVVSPSRFESFSLAPGKEIEQQAASYNKAILDSQDPQELDRQGQALYQMLVAPARKWIPAGSKLVIVPHGGLTKLNFETLRLPRPEPHYWIQDVELETSSSSSLLIQARRGAAPSKKMLLIGNPVQASSDYPPLKHAGEELSRLEARFPAQETTVSGRDATPSAFQLGHPERFEFIHFVTHGTASELSPLESAIVLSPEADNSFKLYARDIVKTRLKAEIVTISACYGAGKRTYSSEGLVGLAWAFLRAGAHQVIAGLWEVDDRATVDLMDDFYGELQKGKSAAAALRLAKLKMVESNGVYSRPYYWGSLQLYLGS